MGQIEIDCDGIVLLPLHRICHRGLQRQLLGQYLDETKGLRPLLLVISSLLHLLKDKLYYLQGKIKVKNIYLAKNKRYSIHT